MSTGKRISGYVCLLVVLPVLFLMIGNSVVAPFYYSHKAVTASVKIGSLFTPNDLALSPDGALFLRDAGENKREVHRSDASKDEPIATLQLWSYEKAVWADSGHRIITYFNYRVRIHDLDTHEIRRLYLASFPGWTPENRVPFSATAFAVSPDGRFLAVSSSDPDWHQGIGLFERLDQAPQNGGSTAPADPSEEDSLFPSNSYEGPQFYAAKVSDYGLIAWAAGDQPRSPRMHFSRDGRFLFYIYEKSAGALSIPDLKTQAEFAAPEGADFYDNVPIAVHPDAPLFSILSRDNLYQLDPIQHEVRKEPFVYDDPAQLVIQPGGRPWVRHQYGFLVTRDKTADGAITRFDFNRDPGYRAPSERRVNLVKLADQPEGSKIRILTGDANLSEFYFDTLDLSVAENQLHNGFERAKGKAMGVLFLLIIAGIASVETARAVANGRKRNALRRSDQLFDGCAKNDLNGVKKASSGQAGRALLRTKNDKGFTPLLIAAGMGHQEVALHLLSLGAPVDSIAPDGSTALHLACCRENSAELALRLLAGGADPTIPNQAGCRPARLASEGGFLKPLETIAKKHPEALVLADADGVTPALAAAINNQTEAFSLCATASPKSLEAIRKEDHSHAAYAAAFHGNVTMLECVVKQAPSMLATRGTNGYLPVTIAAQKGHTACVRLLAQSAPATLSETMPADSNVTAANLAAQNGHAEVLEILASVAPKTLGHPRTPDNATPALAAAFKGHSKCLEVIGRISPAFLGMANQDGHTPAFMAAQEGHLDCLKTIVKHLPEVLAGESGGLLALIAAQSGHGEVVGYLLAEAPDTFRHLHQGNNALHAAAAAGQETVFKLIAESLPALLETTTPEGLLPAKLLENVRLSAAKAAHAESGKDSDAPLGVVLWGVGFRPDADMLRTAILLKSKQNMLAAMLLMGLPSEIGVFDEMPSEIEACMAFSRIAKRNRWKDITPNFQTLGLQDGRKLILAYPPLR